MQRLSFLKDIFGRLGVAVVLTLYAGLQLIYNLIGWLLPPETQTKYQLVKVLQFVSWRTWIIGLLIILLVIVFEGAYRTHTKKLQELNDAHRKETSALRAEINTLESQIDELTQHKLKFTILATHPHPGVRVYHHQETFAPPEIVPEEIDRYIIRLYLKICFENTDMHPLVVKSMDVSLVKITEKEDVVPVIGRELYEQYMTTDSDPLPLRKRGWAFRRLSVNGRESTLYHTIEGDLVIAKQYGEELDESYFLRVTMTAMNQPLYSLDFNVDWQAAFNLGSSITSRS